MLADCMIGIDEIIQYIGVMFLVIFAILLQLKREVLASDSTKHFPKMGLIYVGLIAQSFIAVRRRTGQK